LAGVGVSQIRIKLILNKSFLMNAKKERMAQALADAVTLSAATLIKKISAIEQFKTLGNYNTISATTRFVCTDEFKGDYAKLECNNGGGWCRFDGDLGKKYKAVKVKENGKIDYSWPQSEPEEAAIKQELDNYMTTNNKHFAKGVKIMLLKIAGTNNDDSTQSIRADIKDILRKKRCPILYTSSSIEIDHKNGRKNNPRVMCTATQLEADFQPLSKAANDAKRQHCIDCKKTGMRFDAMQMGFKVSVTEGTIAFGDPANPDGCLGCYWYDIEDFHKKI
jgi:hypothetical protein